MKILFITHYYEPDSGAAANRLTRLAKHLRQRGHQVTVLTTMPHYPQGVIAEGYRRRWTVVEEREGVRVIQVWLWTSASSAISRRLISQLSFMLTCGLRGLFVPRPDVILIENQPIFTALAGWFISKVKRRRYVVNASDYWPEYLVVAGVVSERSWLYRVFKSLTNLTQRQAGAIVAMLDDLMTRIETRIGPVKHGRVIYNAVDLDVFHPAGSDRHFRDKYELSNDKLITFLGVLGTHIDLDTMLQTAQAFSNREGVTFLFVGTGAQKAQLLDALQQPEYAHCRWIEWIGTDELPGFWAASYLTFWALHHNELDRMRFQAKLYEALASGTPSIIGVDGLMSTFLHDTETGITVMPGDADAMIAAIEDLLTNDERYAAMSQRARLYAEQHFDLKRTVDAYEAVLQEVAER